MFKLLFDTSYVRGESDEFKAKWCMLRAIEWGQWPLFVAQPIAPLVLLYMPAAWLSLVILLVVLSWLWAVIRYRFVSLPLAQFATVFVGSKWFTAIGAGAYLAYHHQYEVAGLAALWPVVTVVLQSLTPSTKIGVLEQMFANRILTLDPQT